MTPSEALRWLYERQFFGIKLGLSTPRRLLEELAHPEKKLRFVHVAGTNGKGSVCAFAEQILRDSGLRTGLFTSPHLIHFGERIRVQGELMPEAAMAGGLTRLRHMVEGWDPPPTFFELTFALAISWFAENDVEVVILETGMGGRLDATNVVGPEVCVITPISFDHQAWLGDTLAQIAGEKAGIIKHNVPVVLCPQPAEADEVFQQTARAKGAALHRIEAPWPGEVSLPGSHQKWNAAAAVAACEIFLPASGKVAAEALPKTVWPGRFQRLGSRLVVDGAHNEAAMARLVETWQEMFGPQQAHIVFGTLRDKSPAQLLRVLRPIAQAFSLVPVRSARGMDPGEMRPLLSGIPSRCYPGLAEAWQDLPANDSLVLITGSLFLAGEALALWQGAVLPISAAQ